MLESFIDQHRESEDERDQQRVEQKGGEPEPESRVSVALDG